MSGCDARSASASSSSSTATLRVAPAKDVGEAEHRAQLRIEAADRACLLLEFDPGGLGARVVRRSVERRACLGKLEALERAQISRQPCGERSGKVENRARLAIRKANLGGLQCNANIVDRLEPVARVGEMLSEPQATSARWSRA